MPNTQTSQYDAQLPQLGNLTGQFLIAMPSTHGEQFANTVIYVVDHTASGALGLVVNRTANVMVSDVLERLRTEADIIEYAPKSSHAAHNVLMGGPVQTERGFVLHTPTQEYAATVRINERLALTSSRDILEDVARGIEPEHMLLALGYAGWGAGQLEEEVAANAWLTVSADEHILFETLPSERYAQALRLLGLDSAKLTHIAGHA